MKIKYLLLIVSAIVLGCSKDNSGDSNQDATANILQPCVNGMAGIYPCEGYDLLDQITLNDLGASSASDIWGWTDATTNREYALIGLDNGTAFIDITDALIYLGKLPTATSSSTWRDIKVYNDHAFIVSEAQDHGMQVFDLTRLRDADGSPENFDVDFHYTGFGNAHNVFINQDTGFAYVVGTARDDVFNGGVHFINVQDPKNPTAAGGHAANGYTHDAQVVSYNGPDTDYSGAEIFVGANENEVVLVDVSNKAAPQEISTLEYENFAYTHQGWFTDDHRYFILGDEIDESNFGFNSRTLVFDFTDLDSPEMHTTYFGPTEAIDHNGYVKGNQFFLANYTAGLRVLDISQIDGQTITEEGFFDSYPKDNATRFDGVWSVYPYFSSGKIIMSDINSGLFVIKRSE